jgi:hypothetical protein
MKKRLHVLAAFAAVAALAACGDKNEGGDAQASDTTTVPAAATVPATTAPMAGDSAAGGMAPPVVQNGEAVTPANGTGAPMAPGDTAFGNTGPAGPSGPGGQDTFVTKPKP